MNLVLSIPIVRPATLLVLPISTHIQHLFATIKQQHKECCMWPNERCRMHDQYQQHGLDHAKLQRSTYCELNTFQGVHTVSWPPFAHSLVAFVTVDRIIVPRGRILLLELLVGKAPLINALQGGTKYEQPRDDRCTQATKKQP